MAYLTGFIISALALVPQPLTALGIEVSLLVTVLFVIGQRRINGPGFAGADTVGRRQFASRSRIYAALAFPGLAAEVAIAFGYPVGIAGLVAIVVTYQVLALLDTWDLVFRAMFA